MKVTLLDYTGAGASDPARYAANLLVFTKQTRLEMTPGLLGEIGLWSPDKIEAELIYMANTIPSSWEFIDYTFLISDVTRAFTHQFVRTRTASFAQQTMRVLNKKGWTYGTGPTIAPRSDTEDPMGVVYHRVMDEIAEAYNELIEGGISIEDARGVLPTNIHTNIVVKANLRTLCDMFRKRASGRTQGEYRDVIEEMKKRVLRAHPWSRFFIARSFDAAAAELEAMIRGLSHAGLSNGDITNMVKLIDQMRMQA